MPSAEEFVAHFTAYRRYFLGVRHHTDKQIKYIEHFLKPETGLRVYGMGGVPTIRAHLSEAFGKAISDERFMVTDRKSAEKKRDPVWNDLRDHYKRDLTVFSAILAGDGDPAQPYVLTPRHKDTPCYFQDPTEPGDAADLDSGWTMQEDDDDMLDPAFEPTRSDRR